MNYVILNGVKSTSISGLLIQSLPPISKPPMRIEQQEIDGRDGDTTIKLGYAAYDKELSIGLYGNYDVDQIIAYFASEGTVIFSNEPDKYYKYSVYEQIDFERLIRFKTATVTMHVQPYKYAATIDNPIVFINPSDNLIVRNKGNTIARPIITIKGTGNLSLSINGISTFLIDLETAGGSICIDTDGMDAYWDGQKKNRHIVGNYENAFFKVGNNTISWSGGQTLTISEIAFENYSLWI